MKKTRIRIHEDMLISRQRIKSEDSSLKVENTAEDLNASITCIESNKLEQENREGYNKVNETQMTACVNVDKIENGVITSSVLSTSALNNISVNINNINIETGDYYISCDIRLKSGSCQKINSLQMIGNINQESIISTEIISFPDISNEFKRYIRKYTIADTVTENEEALRFLVQATNCENAVFEIKNIQISRENREYEQFGQSPSTKYKSEVLGVTGDVKLKVQTKNIAQNIQYSNSTQQYRPTVITNYKLKKRKYYIFSCDTENTGEKIYLNVGEGYGIRYIQTWDKMHKICDGTRKYWIVKASDSALHVNRPTINKSSVGDGTTNGVHTGFTYNFMIEEIKATTDEEALKYVSSKYVEHKEQNFTISLGNKTLYKGDKIVRQNGKWYFSNHWKRVDDFSVADFIGTAIADKKRLYLNLTNNYKKTDTSQNINGGWSNIIKLIGNGRTYQNEDGFTTNENVSQTGIGLYIYIEDFAQLTLNKYKENLKKLGTYFILPIEEELELIEGEILIKQLDKILLNIYEYDDETNFDFDQDVTFEIEVEKDNIRLLNSRLDELEKQSITTSALALESED